MPEQQKVKSGLVRVTYAPGERIFHEGEAGDAVYFIESGLVELSKSVENDCVVLFTMSKGDILGEMALVDGAPRSATARCTQETVVIKLPRVAFDSRLDAMDPMMQRILKRFADIIRNMTREKVEKSRVIR